MTRKRLTQELKRLSIGWSLLCGVGATVGGIIGYVSWVNDSDQR